MDPLTSAAASGLQARIDSFDMLANNLANASSSGFKTDREFYSTFVSPDASDGFSGSVGDAPVVQKQWTDFSQGTLINTGSATDLALAGSGFFGANGPNGTLYTRAGSFRLTASGVLVTTEGYPVRLTGGTQLQTQSSSPLQISADGQVTQDGNVLGQIEVSTFKDASQLVRASSVYFQNPDGRSNPPAAASAPVYQGKLESSNAAPAEAAARMISMMRNFEMLQHAIKIGTDMNRQAVEQVARVGS